MVCAESAGRAQLCGPSAGCFDGRSFLSNMPQDILSDVSLWLDVSDARLREPLKTLKWPRGGLGRIRFLSRLHSSPHTVGERRRTVQSSDTVARGRKLRRRQHVLPELSRPALSPVWTMHLPAILERLGLRESRLRLQESAGASAYASRAAA